MMSNCTDVIVHYKVLDMFFFVGTYVIALMLLCILYWVLRCNRTFAIGTDVIMPMCSCTDVIVHYV